MYSLFSTLACGPVFGVNYTLIIGIDTADLDFGPPTPYQVVVPFILPPLVSSNQALLCPELFDPEIILAPAETESLTDWLSSQLDLSMPNAEALSLLSIVPDGCDLTDWLNASLSLPQPSLETITILSDADTIDDLTEWIAQALSAPEIFGIGLLEVKAKSSGKSYQSKEDSFVNPSPQEESDICRHGLKKRGCADCKDAEKREKEKHTLAFDVFDLILPTLHPPLGDNFDNPISFPVGKTLYPFQCEGVRFLVEHNNALLGDEMGLGKSIQTITALRLLFRLGRIKSALLLCPKAVVTDWETKFFDWAPELRVQKVRGVQYEREIFWDTPAHIYLTTYESFREDLRANIAKSVHDICILDEIQKIKNQSSKLSQAARLIKANRRWGLSGTPLENRLDDVIAIFSFLVPGLFGREDSYTAASIREKIAPYFLRRRKIEALPELPPKIHNEVWLELLPSQQKAYDRAKELGVVELNDQGEKVTLQHVFALITKLKQLCNLDPVSQTGCKLEYLSEKLEELTEQGDKALVFSQFPEKTLKFIAPQLEDFAPLSYDGSLSDQQRNMVVKKFQEGEDNKVLLMSVKSGGVGITLTRASYVYHFDLWWNPSVAAQAEDRAHRIGQKKTVFVTSLYTRNTIEERIKKLLDQKRMLFNAVIDDLSDVDLKNLLTEDEIFGLFDLQKPKREFASDVSRFNSNKGIGLIPKLCAAY